MATSSFLQYYRCCSKQYLHFIEKSWRILSTQAAERDVWSAENLHAHGAMTVVEGYAQDIGSWSKPVSVDIASQL